MKSSTGLVVITLLLLGCSAAFGEGLVTLGFLDSTGTFQFCDYENFSYGTSLAAGIDVQSACPFNDGSMIGVVATIPASSGYPVTGQLVVLATAS